MKALVYKNRVAQVTDSPFEVHPSLVWMDAPEGCEPGWELVDGTLQAPAGPTAEEVAAAVRNLRDARLSETDWIVIKAYERNENIPAEWELYRQALRDVPEQSGFPFNVTWPEKPGS